MIKLKIESYCEQCGDFEPVCRRNEFRSVAGGHRYFETTVVCEHRDKCARLARWVEKAIEEKEMGVVEQ